MKNLLILGAARGGKTTLAKMVSQKWGYGIVSVDALVSAFQEAFENVRKYEQKFDYTKAMSDEEVLNMVTRHINHSKEVALECQKFNFRFVDTSYDRDKVLLALLKELEQKLIF